MNLSSMSPIAITELESLELSQQPAERSAQVRILKNLFSLLSRQPAINSSADKAVAIQLSGSPAIRAVVAAILSEIPDTEDFGSFEELKSQRDSAGVVRGSWSAF
jgi:hypothetical protein